jgi:RNA polymerase sigma-70 factor (ECF subfamily)
LNTVMDREAELALVRRLGKGDEAAFDAVYDEYRTPLFGFLRRLTRLRETAEDLLEETWLRLVTNARALRPDTRIAAWLYTVARNLYWSHCRSRLPHEARTVELVDLWPVADERPSPLENAEASELALRLERALADLPARHREVLLLVAAEGLAPAEAAIVCGITAEAFRQRLSRARSALAAALDALPAAAVAMTKEVKR